MSIKKHVDLLDRLAYVLNGQHTWSDYTDVSHTSVHKTPSERTMNGSKKRFKWVKKLLLVLVLLIENGFKRIKSITVLRSGNISKPMDGENRMRD